MSVINFNFATHWDSKISPHLEDAAEVQSIVKKCWERFAEGGFKRDRPPYSKTQSPLEMFGTGQFFSKFSYTLFHQVNASERSILPEKYVKILEAEDGNGGYSADDETDDDISTHHRDSSMREIEACILKLKGYGWPNAEQPRLYVPFGCCHIWNPTFGLWLANKVLPHGKWQVRRSTIHTTVYSKKLKMVFDILYFFALENLARLEAYEDGTYDEKKDSDQSFGGNRAFHDSAPKAERSASEERQVRNEAKKAARMKAKSDVQTSESKQSSAAASHERSSAATHATASTSSSTKSAQTTSHPTAPKRSSVKSKKRKQNKSKRKR